MYNGDRKVCVNFKTDTDKLIIVVYRHQNSFYLEDSEVDLNFTEYQSLLVTKIFSSHIDIFHKRCILLDETTVRI